MERTPPRNRAASIATLVVLSASVVAQSQARVTFEQAAPVFTALPSNLPIGLRDRSRDEIARLWPSWIDQHDRAVRARLARGDEDSLVNFWLYGTSFTARPPAVARASSSRSAAALDDIIKGRLEDLLDRVTRPGDDERLQFARRVLGGNRDQARRLLLDARQRMIQEFAGTEQTLAAARRSGSGALTSANATIFRDRGLSSDTSILADYSVHVALEVIAKQNTFTPGAVRRVAIVGPGLDFTNKADGYDYYPQQTIQPFAVINSLRRLGLAAADLRVTTFDINTRVNEHLMNAASRAASPSGYVVVLPLDGQESWASALVAYWQQWGSAIGNESAAVTPSTAAGIVKTRAVRIESGVVASVTPRDLNIVVDRIADGDTFDLIVATNVLVYYDVFEQALAAANVASMLRPGGVFVTNTAVLPTQPLQASASYLRVAHTPDRYDEIFWYQR